MAKAAGYVIAAGAIVLANDSIFVPIDTGSDPLKGINWRIVPATAILAILLTGVEKLAPEFGAALGGLVLLSVLVIPVGNAPTPLENVAKLTSTGTKKVTG
jgi:hypothetical protein